MAKEYNYVFKRNEIKYLITKDQYTALRDRFSKWITPDAYGDSTICNIYYDTPTFDLIRRSLEKPVYKEKFRVRSYGVATPDSTVFLEIKKKYKSVVYKRRLAMKKSEADRYIFDGILNREKDQILSEVDYFLDFYHPLPAAYIACDRLACIPIGTLAEECPSFRVTFDKNIRGRTDRLDLCEASDGLPIELPRDTAYLMEIKAGESIPLCVVDILSDLKIYSSSFSKYGKFYTDYILSNKAQIERNIKECSQA